MTSENFDKARLELAERLRQAREYVGLSQDDVAAQLKLSRPVVSNLESGQRKVEAIELRRLAEMYGKTVEYFLTGLSQGATNEEVQFLARATKGLASEDMDELKKFADYLRSRGRKKKV